MQLTLPSPKSKLFLVLKLILFAYCLYIVGNKLMINEWFWVNVVHDEYIIYIICFMLLNWLFEIFKWHKLINEFESQTFIRSAKTIFISIYLGFITPNRIGELPARALSISKENKDKAWVSAFLTSIIQSSITLIGGVFTFVFLKENIFEYSYNPLWLLLIGVLSIVFVIWFAAKTELGKQYLQRIKLAYSTFSQKVIWNVIKFSVLRYFIFIIQYALAFAMFGIEIDLMGVFSIVGASFLILAIVPSLFLGELGIRESVMLGIAVFYGINDIAIIQASLLIWTINLVFPSIIGGLLFLKLKR